MWLSYITKCICSYLFYYLMACIIITSWATKMVISVIHIHSCGRKVSGLLCYIHDMYLLVITS